MNNDLKREIILDNYQNPANRGLPEDSNYQQVNSRNESCVDNITVAALIKDGKIEDIKFDGEACAICTSATSVMTKELKGKTLEEAEKIVDNYNRMIGELPYEEEVLGELNIYNEIYKQPSRKKCALLPMDAIKKVIDDNQ